MEAWIDWLLGKVQYLCYFYPFFFGLLKLLQGFFSHLIVVCFCRDFVKKLYSQFCDRKVLMLLIVLACFIVYLP